MSYRVMRALCLAFVPAVAAAQSPRTPAEIKSVTRANQFPANFAQGHRPSVLKPTSHAPLPTRSSSPALDTAIARMGGADVLGRIERVRFEMMTLWMRMTFDNRPNDMLGSYELHSDLRNYALDSWRNTRRSIAGPNLREMVDVVDKQFAIRRLPVVNGVPTPFMPLSIAYVDERKEIFAFAPERLLLAARVASDLKVLADTTIGGIPHARVSATVSGFPSTIFLRKSDGLLAMVRYRAAQLNDFGLAPWGNMEVELWYSRWAQYPFADTRGIAYPSQWDVKRVGQLYKRLVVLQANLNAVAPADSFAISDSLRSAFIAGASNKPMWDFAMDSAKLIDPRMARFGVAGQAQNAVKIGTQWLFLEGPAVPQIQDRDIKWLQSVESNATVGGLLITTSNTSRGGAAWFAQKRLPVYIAPGTSAAMAETFANWQQPRTSATSLVKPQWIRVGGDSLWVETIDFPDFPRAIIAYVPSMRWVYSGLAATPLNLNLLVARVAERNWKVDSYGTVRGMKEVFPQSTTTK